ncbi:hypothetical protein SDC9_145445 [bioreactor metagenome]|uniref:Uncharacterized protein n=1 Tax=bioreactor metagenome TaxID=1076179 RepID=A0A645E8Z7_9ZZZZ
MIMRRKHRFCPELFPGRIFENGAGDAHAVIGRCASAYFVIYNEALFSRVFENICDLVHFDHKGRTAR